MNQSPPLDDAPAGLLVREIFDDARELVRIEVALAKSETRAELAQLRSAAIIAAIAGCAGCMALTLALVAVAVATATPITAALLLAAGSALVALVAGVMAWRRIPTKILGTTRTSVARDVLSLEGRAHGA